MKTMSLRGSKMKIGNKFDARHVEKFICSDSTITAPEILLPSKSQCQIAPDCHLVGKVIHADETTNTEL